MDTGLAVLILAVVQGMTEFLPISSSGHLVLLGELFGQPTSHPALAIVLHGATLIAAIAYFRQDICRLIRALFSREPSRERSLVYAVVLATAPIVCVGFFVYPVFASVQTVSVVAIALIVSGSALILADYSIQKGWLKTNTPLWQKGIGVGLMQVLALLPGVSRSGITIAGGRVFGFSREEATRFSFLLAIPTILGALVLLCMQTSVTVSLFSEIGFGIIAGWRMYCRRHRIYDDTFFSQACGAHWLLSVLCVSNSIRCRATPAIVAQPPLSAIETRVLVANSLQGNFIMCSRGLIQAIRGLGDDDIVQP